MGRVLFLFLALPWWAYFPIAGGIAWFGERAQLSLLAAREDRAEAVPAGPFGADDMSGLEAGRDGDPGGEITLRGLINPDLTRTLTRPDDSGAGAPVSLYLLFAENDPEGAEAVRAAVLLDEPERASFDDMLATFPFDANRHGYIFEMNGLLHRESPYAARVSEAIAEQGLRAAPDFVFVTPVLSGHAALLAPLEGGRRTRELFWTMAAVVAFLGVAKRVLSVLCVGPGCLRAEALETMDQAEDPPVRAEIRDVEDQLRGAASHEDGAAPGRSDMANPPEAAPADHSDHYYYAGLASAMLFVGTLSYDPALALRLFGVLALLFLVVRFSVRLLRRNLRHRAKPAV